MPDQTTEIDAVPAVPSDSHFESFLNQQYGTIGRTVSTRNEPNTSSKLHFWVADSSGAKLALEIGNIVAAVSDDGIDVTFGVVTEMRAYSDIDSFISDFLSHNFGEADVQVPTDISEVVVVTCAVMRNITNTSKPVGRSRVFFPSRLGIQFAYGIVNESGQSIYSGTPIPIGIFENGDGTEASIDIDENFLLGPDGAHLNISGISGLASKTSAIEFVLKSLQEKTRRRVAVVMFNVKSRDLLYVDQNNPMLDSDTWSQDVYRALQIEPKGFASARFFAPRDQRQPGRTQSLRTLPTSEFSWDLHMIRDSIPTLFSAADWDDRIEGAWYTLREEIARGQINSYADLVTWLESQLARVVNQSTWRGSFVMTWQKLLSHLKRFPRSFPGLIAPAGPGRDLPWSELTSGSVFIIDIQMLSDRGQRLVFGRCVSSISDILEREESQLDAVVVFVDELNKFAPAGSYRSPLKERLIDITARGRSIGLVLFGAEQFASSVDKEIIENSSTYLFGRTESSELRAPNYAALTDEMKAKLTMLPQGHLLARFAKFPQPIFVRFPYPPCIPGDQFGTIAVS